MGQGTERREDAEPGLLPETWHLKSDEGMASVLFMTEDRASYVGKLFGMLG